MASFPCSLSVTTAATGSNNIMASWPEKIDPKNAESHQHIWSRVCFVDAFQLDLVSFAIPVSVKFPWSMMSVDIIEVSEILKIDEKGQNVKTTRTCEISWIRCFQYSPLKLLRFCIPHRNSHLSRSSYRWRSCVLSPQKTCRAMQGDLWSFDSSFGHEQRRGTGSGVSCGEGHYIWISHRFNIWKSQT